MSVTIPLRTDLPHYDLQVELDGATYGLEFLWNPRSEAWSMTISSADGTVLAAGLRVVVDWAIGKRLKDATLPPGVFMAQDTSGERRDPGLEDLGRRVLLLYFSQDE